MGLDLLSRGVQGDRARSGDAPADPRVERGGAPKALRLTLIRGFQLGRPDQPISLPMSAQRLVAFLAIHRRALRRAFVAGTLWPDTTDDRAGASLRSALWRLNRPGRHVLEAGGSHLQLAPDVDVDLWGTTSLARGLLDGSIPGELLDGCDVSLSGDLLPEWYDDWVVIERERFRQLRLHALEALAEGLTSAGRFSDAIQAGLTAVASEPLRESAHRVLIQVYLAEGNGGEALRVYRGFRDLVRDELGVSPSAQMLDLVRGFRI